MPEPTDNDLTADEARRFGHELGGKIIEMCIASEEHPKSVGFAFARALMVFMCALASEHDARMELFDAWAELTRNRIANTPRDAGQEEEATGQSH